MRLQSIIVAALLANSASADGPPPPVTDDAYRMIDQREARLGQLLFYDTIL